MNATPARLSAVLGMLVALTAAPAVRAADLTPAELEHWLAAYGEAWVARDPDKAAALFTETARYRENPFEPALEGRTGIHAYWANVTADQRDVEFKSAIIAVRGRTGIAQWAARFKSASSGATVHLDGVFVLEFAEGGLCHDLREWWIVKVDAPAQE